MGAEEILWLRDRLTREAERRVALDAPQAAVWECCVASIHATHLLLQPGTPAEYDAWIREVAAILPNAIAALCGYAA